jgi:hypothetical protein
MIRSERLKNTVNKYMADMAYDLSVRTEVDRKSTTKCTARQTRRDFQRPLSFHCPNLFSAFYTYKMLYIILFTFSYECKYW